MEGDSYKVTKSGVSNGLQYRRMNIAPFYETYEATFEIIHDQGRCYWKTGDIVQFDSGYHRSWKYEQRWQSWFMEKDKYLQFLKENCARRTQVPMYAAHQFGIILNRYKWVKHKMLKKYSDYGSIVVMLTGKRAGHIRKYYTTSPWTWVGSYPYDHIGVRYLEIEPVVKELWSDNLNQFLKNVVEKLS